jgi:hypothetical protein
MRKEKFSYLILFVEIVAIIWLHSNKQSQNQELSQNQLVKRKLTHIKNSTPALFHQAAVQSVKP